MKIEVREALGNAAYDALAHAQHEKTGEFPPVWENIGEQSREEYRIEAEGVVEKLAEMLIPVLLNALLSEKQIEDILRRLWGMTLSDLEKKTDGPTSLTDQVRALHQRLCAIEEMLHIIDTRKPASTVANGGERHD